MTRNKAFLITQSLLCVMIAFWMAAAAIDMYVKGAAIQASGDMFNYIFTREKVTERLFFMLPLIFCAMGMTVAGWILGVKDEKADRPVLSPELQRNLICKGVQTFSPAMKSERVLQRKLLGIRWAVFIVCLIPLAAYVLNGVHFDHPHDTEADLLALLWVLIPCAVLGITCLAITGVLQDKSYAREIEAAKNQATAERKAGINRTLEGTGKTYPQTKDRFTFYLRATIFILAVVFILAGIQNGGLEDVLIKANVICMECVGLG